jgi:hypothetical protein
MNNRKFGLRSDVSVSLGRAIWGGWDMPRIATEPFDQEQRLQLATAALDSAAESARAASSDGPPPPDLVPPDGWRWRVLSDLTALSRAVNRDYEQARTKQARQAWQSRFGGPVVTGAGAAIGSVVAAVGAGLVKTSTASGWAVVILGVLFAVGGSVISSNNYVQNRNKQLRFLRLLYDIWDYAYLVLPTAAAADTFTQLDTFRTLWETAGT